MNYYLILQYPYEIVQVALCQNGNIIQEITQHKHHAIRTTIPNIQALLDQHNLKLSDIACIGINVGPGPYNTLRALLTMANGIHFAIKTPLIAMSALELLQSETEAQNSLVILHAFLGHVFYRMKLDEKIIEGSSEITDLIKIMNEQELSSPLLCTGNGAALHQQILLDACNQNIIFAEKIIAFNSLQRLAQATHEKLEQKDFAKDYVQPIYFDNLTKK